MYDAANQLIRENLYYGTGNSNNATITYQYDSWGNLLNKKIYAYTTGTLGTVQETVTYTYGNSSWKDQLTSYNGQSITYDASGNPTSYLGAALAWEGQRLKSYTPASTGSGRVNAYTYNYDENGIRTRKTVGNTVTDYYYNGSLLIGIVQTTTNSDGSTETSMQRFSYDADGKVVGVNYNGTYYYYLRNAQGDIVKLIDKTGSTVVEYTYDTWGKLLSTTGSLAATFGADQPFRYRGYVYDEETGFYYLQSRYYNPEVGRFISADVYLSTGQGVLGHNSYAYCLNNPVNLTDEFGLRAIPWYALPDWGYIHRQVQEHLRMMYGFCLEVTVTLPGGAIGRIDLLSPNYEAWEVKPINAKADGIWQLKKYCTGTLSNGAKPTPGPMLENGSFVTADGMFTVEYWFREGGLIEYSFDIVEGCRVPVTVPVTEPDKDEIENPSLYKNRLHPPIPAMLCDKALQYSYLGIGLFCGFAFGVCKLKHGDGHIHQFIK